MHLNDNKYRFQSNRQKHAHDLGNVMAPPPIINLFKKDEA